MSTALINEPLKIDINPRKKIEMAQKAPPCRNRIRSASVGRDKKSDMQARYWAFLFENLRRSVDDLYLTCESDDSIPAAKEVILILDNYVRDFKNLADWLKLKWEYDNTPPLKRPTSLAWEVRKTSPSSNGSKLFHHNNNHLSSSLLLMTTGGIRNFEVGKEDVIKEVDVSPEQECQKPIDISVSKTPKTPLTDQDSNHTSTKERLPPSTDKSTSSCNENTTSNTIELSAPETLPSKVALTTESSQPKVALTTESSQPKVALTTESSQPKVASSSSNLSTTATTLSTTSVMVLTKGMENSSMKSQQSRTSRPSASSARPKSSLVKRNGPQMSSTTSIKNLTKPTAKPLSNTNVSNSTRNTTKPLVKSKTLKPSGSPASQRLSLVARQASKAPVNTSKNSPKTPRSRPGPVRSVSNLVKSTIETMKYNGPRHSVSGIPFGSTSSINSSCSVRSWADTVKGLNSSVTRSADNLMADKKRNSKGSEELKEDEGWKTVKSRSRSRNSLVSSSSSKLRSSLGSDGKVSYNAKSRYKLPSSAASLPCLLSEEPEEDEDENKSEIVKPASNPKKALRYSKSLSSVSKKDRLKPSANLAQVAEGHSSNESIVSDGNSASKVQSKNLNELTEESVRAHNETYSAEIAEKEVAIAEAEKEEENLAREILETEKAELTEDTDGDTDIDKRSDSASSSCGVVSALSSSMMAASTNTPPISFEGLSWVEQIDLEEQMESARYPGRVIQLHEKLSSPARKKEPHEAFKAHQEKQIRAQARRSKFQDEKASKLAALNTRILEVIAKKEQLINERSEMILDKMRKAEVKRQEHIEGIRKKAHEEDAKLKEIAFINELQAQNMRIDIMSQNQSADEKCEWRLAELAEERAKKAEQREAKEARAEERRREMELKRIKDVEKLKERIRNREERIQEEQEQLRKDRIEAAREKARDREERLSTVRAAEKDMKEELQEKIAIKQETAAKRHKERLENIRAKAFELSVQRGLKDDDASVPRIQPYDPKKKCEICEVLILNEVQLQSHIRGKLHTENVSKMNEGRSLSKEEIQSCNLKRIVDASEHDLDPKALARKERSKSMKKRVKKIKNRMINRAVDYEANLKNKKSSPTSSLTSPNRAKIGRALKDIEKVLNSQGKGSWPNSSISSLDRSLGEISRSFDKNHRSDQYAFYHFQGFSTLSRIFGSLAEQKTSCVIPLKSICGVCKIWSAACFGHRANTEYVLMSNSLTLVVDILRERLNLLIPEGIKEDVSDDFYHLPDWPIVEPIAQSILNLLTSCLDELVPLSKEYVGDKVDLESRVQDHISYIISSGIVDQLAGYFHKVQDSIDDKPEVGEFLLSTLRFLSSLISVVEEVLWPNNASAIKEDPTHLFLALRYTDLAGTVSMLYGMLLHQDRPPRESVNPPEKLPDHTLKVALATARLLHRMVRTNLEMVQGVLGSEGISLEFRHIASYLIWYCLQFGDREELLLEVIVLVGYFSAKHVDNQIIVKSGNQPSVLQQLCSLPFHYFSQPDLKKILFPTLLACCHGNDENLGILFEEVNWSLINDYVNLPEGKNNHLVQLVLSTSSSKNN